MPRLDLENEANAPVLLISGTPISVNKTGAWRSIRPQIDLENCTKCMVCWKFCPEVCVDIDIDSGIPVIDMSYCKGCAICAEVCPKHCVQMIEEGGS